MEMRKHINEGTREEREVSGHRDASRGRKRARNLK